MSKPKPNKTYTSEAAVKRRLDRELKKLQANPDAKFWFYSPQAGPYGQAGIPDRVVCAGGCFIGIECKRDRNAKPRKIQNVIRDRIIKARGGYFLVYDEETIMRAMYWLEVFAGVRLGTSGNESGEV